MTDENWTQNWIYVEHEPIQAWFDGWGIPVCFNGGLCLKTGNEAKPYRCHCPEGWKGEWCELQLCFAKGKTMNQPIFCQNNGRCDWVEGGCTCPEGYTGETCELPCPAVYIDEKEGKKYCMVGTDSMMATSLFLSGTLDIFCPVPRDNRVRDSKNLCSGDSQYQPLHRMAPGWQTIWKKKFGDKGEISQFHRDENCSGLFGQGFKPLDCSQFPEGFCDDRGDIVNLKTIWQRMLEHDFRVRKMPPTPMPKALADFHTYVDNGSAIPLQAFGGVWWVEFGKKAPQLPRVMVLPVDISDNADFYEKAGVSGKKIWYSCAPQNRKSKDQEISSVIGGFSLLPI